MNYISEQKYKSVFKTYLIYFIALVCFVGVRILSSLGVFSSLNSNAIDIIYTILIEVICLFLIPFILYCVLIKVKPKHLMRTCNFNKISFKTILLSILLGILMYFLTVLLSTFFNGIIVLFGYQSSGGGAESIDLTTYIIQIFTTALLPAFCEEFLHRGILLQGTKHIGFTKAIIISSLLFGLVHLNITQVFYAAVLGLIIGYVAVVTKNIWPAIIIHFMNNFMSITDTFLSSNNPWYQAFMKDIYLWFQNLNYILTVLIITGILFVLVILIYFLITRLYYHGLVKKVEKAISDTYLKTGQAKSNQPIFIANEEVLTLVENTTTLNLDFDSIKNPLALLMPKQKNIYKPTLKDNIFLKGAFILSITITIFTFIWGLM